MARAAPEPSRCTRAAPALVREIGDVSVSDPPERDGRSPPMIRNAERDAATADEPAAQSGEPWVAPATVEPETAALADDLVSVRFILATCPVCGCGPGRAPAEPRAVEPPPCARHNR